MKAFIIGVIVGILLVPIGAYLMARAGRIPVATASSPLPMETLLAKTALQARLRREAPTRAGAAADPADLALGASVYKTNCAQCHGLPGQPQPAAAKGMFPTPPQLLSAAGMVTDDPVGVTYWKVKNGIRLSGMPAFQGTLSEQQLWQVSQLLAHADKLPADIAAKLQ